MIQELDSVVLAHSIEAHGLEPGDVGTVVHVYAHEAAFEVEFVTAEGKAVALLTLKGDEIRPTRNSEIFHVRELMAGEP